MPRFPVIGSDLLCKQVVFRSESSMVFNEAAFLQIPGILSITHTDTTKKGKFSIDDTYVPPRPVGAGAQDDETLLDPATVTLGAESGGGGSPYLALVMGCSGIFAVLATATALIRRRTTRNDDVKGKDMDPVEACKDKDGGKVGKSAFSNDGATVRLRRTNSNEEMMRDQALGVKTLEVSGEKAKLK